MRLFMAAATWLSLVLVPFTASALGLGDIALDSALNEPFSAEIPLESVEASELADLKVSLASVETFKRYGLDRPAFLSSFRFTVTENENGTPVISLSSLEPVAEPFVTMLLDVSWASGRLLREYTVLLDPPLFEDTVVQSVVRPAQTAPAATSTRPVAQAEPEISDSTVIAPTGLFQQTEKTTQPEAQPASQPVAQADPEPVVQTEPEATVEETAVVEPARAPVYSAPAPVADANQAGNYTTRRGDTLWRIAENTRGGTGLSNNQMMLALYRANPEAFMGNINALKAGAIMRIPATDNIEAPDRSAANIEVTEQHAAWEAEKSGSAPPVRQAGEAADQGVRLQLVAPTGTDDADGYADQDADGSAADGSGDAASAAGEQGDLQEQIDERQRLLQIRDAEMQALQQRIAAQEQAAADGDVLLDESQESIASSESQDELLDEEMTGDAAGLLADDELADAEAVTEPAVDERATRVPAAGSSVVTIPEDEGSLIGGLLGNMWLWVGAAIALLLGLGMIFARRRMAAPVHQDATGSWVTDIAEPSPEATLKDFGDLLSNQDSIVVEEDSSTVMRPRPEEALDKSASRETQDDFSDAALDEEVAGDLDFDIDSDEVAQEASGQDEVEMPLEKTISTGQPLNLDQADPIAEAEFHMAYGLYDQAADLLGRALQENPENQSYRVKLIEVYFVWENKEGFLEQAHALHAAIGDSTDADWNKVLILGKQLCPDDALFSGADAGIPMAGDMDLELSEAGETELDFTLGGTSVEALDVEFGQSVDGTGDEESGGLDFDFGGDSDDSDGDGDDLTLNFGDDDFAGQADLPAVDTLALDKPPVDFDFSDAAADSAATMETPTIESPMNEPTVESPTLDTLGATSATSEMPALDIDDGGLDEMSGLDVDLSGLADLPIDDDDLVDLGFSDSAVADDNANDIDLGPVFANDDTRIPPETENIRLGDQDETVLARIEDLGKIAGDTEFNFDSDEVVSDTVEQPQVDAAGDTAEQPAIAEIDDIDLASLEDTTSDATMTEVGTKLDLARAYIDMGDPDGARSILKEVLDEGGESQQQQARQLLEELND